MRPRYRLSTMVLPLLLLLMGLWGALPAHAVYNYISGSVPVDNGHNLIQPASDGSFVLFTSTVYNDGVSASTLYRAATDEDMPRALVRDIPNLTNMQLTPDDRYLLYISGADPQPLQLWRVDVQTGAQLLLDEGYELGGGPSFQYLFNISPDSQYAIYARSTAPFSEFLEIVAVPVAGGPSVNLTKPDLPDGMVYEFLPSPDSRHVVYLWKVPDGENNLLISVPVTGGDWTILNATGVRPLEQGYHFTPDGQTVVFAGKSQPGRLYRASVVDGTTVPISTEYEYVLINDITSDGQYAIVQAATVANPQESLLLRVKIDDGGTTTLVAVDGSMRAAIVAPEGDYVAFAAQLAGDPTQLFSVNWRALGAPIQIGTNLGNTGICGCPYFTFSPDGTHVVHHRASGLGNPKVLFSSPVDGSTPEQMLYPGYTVDGSLISKDSRRVYFHTRLAGGNSILSVPITGGDTTLVYQSAGGEPLLFRTFTNNRVLLYELFDTFGSLVVADESSPTVQFVSEQQWAAEGDETVTIPVTLNGASVVTTTVQIAITGGTATEGDDYTFTPQTLTFAPGNTTQTATLTLLPDELSDSGETITFAISSPSGGTLGTPTTLTVTLFDTLHRTYLPVAVQ